VSAKLSSAELRQLADTLDQLASIAQQGITVGGYGGYEITLRTGDVLTLDWIGPDEAEPGHYTVEIPDRN
jgi:hypothetical protein